MKAQPKTYTFHHDPGHGWLEVPLTDLCRSGAQQGISSFSYLRRDSATNGTVFLEEDCDAHKFLSKLKEGSYKIEPKYYDGDCFIRELSCFPA